MTSVTLSVDNEFKEELKSIEFANWSQISREEVKKKIIFEKFLKTRKVSDTDWKFCEKIDWHPIDELPIDDEYFKKLDKIHEEHVKKYGNKTMTIKDVNDLFK